MRVTLTCRHKTHWQTDRRHITAIKRLTKTKTAFLLLLNWCHFNISTAPGQWPKHASHEYSPLHLKINTKFLGSWLPQLGSAKAQTATSSGLHLSVSSPVLVFSLPPTFLLHSSSLLVRLSPPPFFQTLYLEEPANLHWALTSQLKWLITGQPY